MSRRYLVWLEWPEICFKASAKDIECLRDLVSGKGEVVWARSEKEFIEALPEATHAVAWHFRKEWFPTAGKLEVLATPAAGREFIAWRDAPAGVKVHFGKFHGRIIGESVLAFCQAWVRGFFRVERMRLEGESIWPRGKISGSCGSVAGTKAVIAGRGNVGKGIADLLEANGVEVFLAGRDNAGEMEKRMPDTDWFVLALPGDSGTDNFLDARRIALLPDRATVVNVGRGNAIDEDALAKALDEGSIAGAYLDVFKGEPTQLAGDGAAASKGLWENPKVVAMPHSSAFSPDYLKMTFMELDREGLL
ncbi:MAG: hypothetical protein J6W80_07095 [Kiritimatiellae bacterium]|nr:hypothetical protein [Kiritimatiellia bacterium]